MANLLSERIAALRKERGLTQEQLGKMTGVSSQAVGKWEKGGAPDVELLPVLSRQLGVTIDALFGLNDGEQISAEDIVRRWIITVPRGQRLNELCRLVWSAVGMVVLPDDSGGELYEFPRESRCERNIGRADDTPFFALRQVSIYQEDGLMIGVNAEDMSFVTLWPEPEAGYEAFLAKNNRYREIFRALAEPHCLELLEYLESKPARDNRRYTPGAVAKALGISKEEATRAVETLAEVDLLELSELETENGPIPSFRMWENNTLVPFLYLARCLAQGRLPNTVAGRKAPVLRGEKWKEGEDMI